MKVLFILNDPPCGAERSHHALRGTRDEITEWTPWADKVLVF